MRVEVKKQYTLEKRDVKVLRHCLNYCYHRLKTHRGESGLEKNVKFDSVQRLRKEIGCQVKDE